MTAAVQFTNPVRAGQLSNKRGSNASSDAILPTARYRGSSGEAPSGIRIIGQRTMAGGVDLPAPQLVWDSSFVGSPVTSPLPATAALSANGAVTAFGRVYVLVPGSVTPASNAVFGVVSAPLGGGNLGPWRWETPGMVLIQDPYGQNYIAQDGVNPGAMVLLSGSPTDHWLFVLGQGGIYRATLSADGTIGTWTREVAGGTAPGAMMNAWQNIPELGTAGTLFIADNVAGGICEGYQVNTDGSIETTPVISTSTGAQIGYGAVHIDPQGGTFVIGGESGAGTPTTVVRWSIINYSANVAGSWGGSPAPLPAARSRFGYVYWPNPNNTADTWVYVCGGIQVSAGARQTTVYRINGAGLRSGGSWTTFTNALPTATASCAAALGIGYPWPQFGVDRVVTPVLTGSVNSPWSYDSSSPTQPAANLFVLGGVATAVVQSTNGGTTTKPWFSGSQAAITGGALGGGGVVTPNPDGTTDITFPYADASQGGLGMTKFAQLADGDSIQLWVQFVSRLTGEVSQVGYTQIKIGQPPSISGLAASSTADGLPTLSMAYVTGAGGDKQASWRLFVTRNSDSVVMFDTLVRPGGDNAAKVYCFPTLASAIAYTVTGQVTSLDDPMAGASDAGSATLALTPSLAAAPSTPTTVTATPNNITGRMTVHWTNPVGGTAVSYNRIYYRRTGDPNFVPLADLYTPVAQGSANTVQLADRIEPGQSYDFAVSSLSALNVEGAKSATASGTISAGSMAFLHVLGKLDGSALSAPIKAIGQLTLATKFNAVTVPLANAAMPVRRFGPQAGRTFTVDIYTYDDASYAALLAVIRAGVAGQVLMYRDRMSMMAVAVGDQNKVQYDSGYRHVSLDLVQVADLSTPYLAQGVGLGVPTLTAGNLAALDATEAA